MSVEELLRKIHKKQDEMDCTADGVVIHVTGFDRICAKVCGRHETIHAFGDDVQEALANLLKAFAAQQAA